MSHRHTPSWILLLALLGGGCSSSGSNRVTLFPQCHTLLESTRAVRQQYASPLPLARELDKGVQPLYTVEPGDVLVIQPANLDSPVRFPGRPARADRRHHQPGPLRRPDRRG